MRKSNPTLCMQGVVNKYLIRELKNKTIVSNSDRLHYYASLLSTFSQQFQLPKHRFKQRRTAQLSALVFLNFLSSLNLKIPVHRFKLCQNAPLNVLVFVFFSKQFEPTKHHFKLPMTAPLSVIDLFLIFSSVPTYKTSFQIATDCTIKCPCFQHFLSSSNFQNIYSNCERMHQNASSFPIFSQQFLTSKHIISNRVRVRQ